MPVRVFATYRLRFLPDTSARRRALGLPPVCRKDIRACPHVHQTVGLIIYPCPSSERVLASGAEVPRLEV